VGNSGDMMWEEFFVCDSLLNDNQRRRLAIFLHLLSEEIASLMALPDLERPIHAALVAVTESAQQIVDEFELPVPREPDAPRRIRATAEVWAMRAYEIRAGALRGFGAVHPELAGHLDPLVEQLQSELRDLVDAAASRVERGT